MRLSRLDFFCMISSFAFALPACGSTESPAVKNATSGDATTASASSSASSAGAGGGGGSGGVTASASSGQGGTELYPAPYPAAPQVIKEKGPVVASPKIVPVFFSNDDPAFKAQVKDYLQKLGGSAYWATIGAEYGVGQAAATPPVESSDAPAGTLSEAELEAWLTGKLDANDPDLPAPDENTIYALIYPAGLSLTSFGGTSCLQFGGYHESTKLDAAHGAQPVYYAAIPRCSGQGFTDLELVTTALSHELIEAATDPAPSLGTWEGVDGAHLYWEYSLGAEVGDLCALSPGAQFVPADLGYMVQRIWSNASAAASHDPCVPIPAGEVYFNSVPVMEDDIPTMGPNGPVKMKGVKLAIGQSKTIDVNLFSDAKTSVPWTIQAFDGQQLFGGAPSLKLNLDKESGENGDVVHLTITSLKAGQPGFANFFLYSKLGGESTMWIGTVAK